MTDIQERDPITLAIEAFDKVYKITGANAKGLRSRLRTLPALVQEAGLVTTLLFYASKTLGPSNLMKGKRDALQIILACSSNMQEEKNKVKKIDVNEFDSAINYLLNIDRIKVGVLVQKERSEEQEDINFDINCLFNKIIQQFGVANKEGGAYGIALALVIFGLIKLCPEVESEIRDRCNEGIKLACLPKLFEKLRENKINDCNEIKAMAVLEDYFITLKRLAEALIGD